MIFIGRCLLIKDPIRGGFSDHAKSLVSGCCKIEGVSAFVCTYIFVRVGLRIYMCVCIHYSS